MDNLKVYWKMCEGAIEIQNCFDEYYDGTENWYRFCSETIRVCPKCDVPTYSKYCPDCGIKTVKKDRYWTDHGSGTLSIWKEEYVKEEDGYVVWLPTQEQLYKMMFKKEESLLALYYDLVNWFHCPYDFGSMPFSRQLKKLEEWNKYVSSFVSIEQLWLAYVMFKKYGKQWDMKKCKWKLVKESELSGDCSKIKTVNIKKGYQPIWGEQSDKYEPPQAGSLVEVVQKNVFKKR